MDALKLLEQDHQDTKTAVDAVGWSRTPKRKELFLALKRGIDIHESIEKNIFYPAMLADARTKALAGWDKEAHSLVDKSLKELTELSSEDPAWTGAFNALRGHLLKHVIDEEDELYKKVRGALGVEELNAIGHKMTTERERLKLSA